MKPYTVPSVLVALALFGTPAVAAELVATSRIEQPGWTVRPYRIAPRGERGYAVVGELVSADQTRYCGFVAGGTVGEADGWLRSYCDDDYRLLSEDVRLRESDGAVVAVWAGSGNDAHSGRTHVVALDAAGTELWHLSIDGYSRSGALSSSGELVQLVRGVRDDEANALVGEVSEIAADGTLLRKKMSSWDPGVGLSAFPDGGGNLMAVGVGISVPPVGTWPPAPMMTVTWYRLETLGVRWRLINLGYWDGRDGGLLAIPPAYPARTTSGDTYLYSTYTQLAHGDLPQQAQPWLIKLDGYGAKLWERRYPQDGELQGRGPAFAVVRDRAYGLFRNGAGMQELWSFDADNGDVMTRDPLDGLGLGRFVSLAGQGDLLATFGSDGAAAVVGLVRP